MLVIILSNAHPIDHRVGGYTCVVERNLGLLVYNKTKETRQAGLELKRILVTAWRQGKTRTSWRCVEQLYGRKHHTGPVKQLQTIRILRNDAADYVHTLCTSSSASWSRRLSIRGAARRVRLSHSSLTTIAVRASSRNRFSIIFPVILSRLVKTLLPLSRRI